MITLAEIHNVYVLCLPNRNSEFIMKDDICICFGNRNQFKGMSTYYLNSSGKKKLYK